MYKVGNEQSNGTLAGEEKEKKDGSQETHYLWLHASPKQKKKKKNLAEQSFAEQTIIPFPLPSR